MRYSVDKTTASLIFDDNIEVEALALACLAPGRGRSRRDGAAQDMGRAAWRSLCGSGLPVFVVHGTLAVSVALESLDRWGDAPDGADAAGDTVSDARRVAARLSRSPAAVAFSSAHLSVTA